MNGRNRRRGLRLLLAALAAAGVGIADAPAADAAAFERCSGTAGRYGFQCAAVTVPLDRSGAVEGTVALHVQRLRARGFASKPPLVALVGGPGQGAGLFATMFAELFRPALSNRDLVVVDQRGTGRSDALRCASLETDVDLESAFAEAVESCVDALGPLVGHYRTLDSVEDLEAVRDAVGVERLALFGVSYGTKVALAYAARHPARVDRLVLDSVVEPDGPDPLYRSSFAAVPRVLREICSRDCAFTSDAGENVAALARSLTREPLTAPLVGPNGARRAETLSNADLFGLLLVGDLDPSMRAALPGAVAAAAEGDAAQAVRLLDDVSRWSSGEADAQLFSPALFFDTTCSDTPLPWGTSESLEQRRAAARAQVDALPDEAFAPFDRATALELGISSMCLHWAAPAAPPPSFADLPDVPALLLNGTLDLRTPVADAEAVARRLPRAQLLAVSGVGHSVLTAGPSCARRAITTFLNERAISTARCASPSPYDVEPPAPRSLDGVAGRGRARVVTALRLTLDDVVRRLPMSAGDAERRNFVLRGGGLRGGRYVARRGRVVLYGVEFVAGVRVSGTLTGRVDPYFGLVTRASGGFVVKTGSATVRLKIARGTIG